MFDDFLISEVISFLVVPLYFAVDFVEAYHEIEDTDIIMKREVLFWNYESHNIASLILQRIWAAVHRSDRSNQ